MRQAKAKPVVRAALLALLLGAASASVRAENIDPADAGQQFAWGENVGWINAEPQGDGGPGAEVTDTGLTGWMWGENVGWISLACSNTGSCGTTDYHVANDGLGTLSGFAWGENVGWIDFAPSTCQPDPTCGVSIDTATGYFQGRAWGENVGWITFSAGAPGPTTARTDWCQSTPPPPGPIVDLVASEQDQDVVLSWPNNPAGPWHYGLIEGRLSMLRDSQGDFSKSTDGCVATQVAAQSFPLPPKDPPVGDGFWYLVRAANCKGHATYDSGFPSQVEPRDAEIAASAHDCP